MVCTLLSLQVQGQTYYNFAMGYIPSATNPSHSIVRTVDAQRAIAYYEDGSTTHILARINMYGNVIEAKFVGKYEMNDIRLVDDDIFFCGQNTLTRKGIVGHASVSAIESRIQHIQYQEFDMGMSRTSTTMMRLAAYRDQSGMEKVVAIGELNYDNLSSPMPSFLNGSLPGSYRAYFVVGYRYSGGALTMEFCKFLCDTSPNNYFESVDDVVVTDNWLAVVTVNDKGLTIHRCDKNNVNGTFDNYHSYGISSVEGIYHCCHMKGDTIALVALDKSPVASVYETHMRCVDLATMTMTQAQGYSLLDKAEPIEVVYVPDCATLVMLQYQQFPLTGWHYAYVFWKPYKVPPYTAEVIYESAGNSFGSIDRLTSKYIVASGGNYWVEKDASYNATVSSCYKYAQQQVFSLSIPNPVPGSFPYQTLVLTLLNVTFPEGYDPNDRTMALGCIFN